jgi:hypothetical protein
MFSLPYLGLPTNVQNRLLSFLLRRLLGHLVVGGQIELDRIDADLTRGKLVLGRVDLEAEVRDGYISYAHDPLLYRLDYVSLCRRTFRTDFPSGLTRGP